MTTAIGQAGTLDANTTTTGQAIEVTFDQPLDDPVIAIMGSNFGGNKYAFRVIEVIEDPGTGLATGFTFTIDEWENHDGPHPRVENINWLAIESGVHTLPDGRTIEAGYVEADDTGQNVALQGDFSGSTPTVLTTVASDRLPSQVDSDPFNITSSGFTVNVEEAESQDGGHGFESVGWIAVQPGTGAASGSAVTIDGIDTSWSNNVDLGATFQNAITVGETQTQLNDDTGNVIFRNQDDGEIDIRFEEDTSVDADSSTIGETVGLVTFESGKILCFTPETHIATPFGARQILDLQPGDLVLTRDHGPKPLRWLSSLKLNSSHLAAFPQHRPVRLRAHSIAPGCPARDLLVSPQHRMLIEGWRAELHTGEAEILAPAIGLLNDRSILRANVDEVTYIHLLFDAHEVIWANGAPSESLHPGALDRDALASSARAELLALFPALRTDAVGFGPLARPSLTARQAAVLA